MADTSKSTATPKTLHTLQELDQAIQEFRTKDLQGEELFYCWQAIRDASLEQFDLEPDSIPGADSY
ncbi:MAG: hypothetical protein B0A82_19865 [Alkalinema sp. CACIAM 70d]|uniref:hypothetical protein n=1 Tax=Alkalinema TaxID=1620700 RepID=UPI000B731059|nr:hypothetical protein [Alkalinema sp. FACHB-956]MBD2330076.1 hypothetical protein [Alkalinema sp. FACHB-956]OUC12923.1 MAG: hypothetical protein B0A82_19865 [Alkalinema sp. CACIAM 70d]